MKRKVASKIHRGYQGIVTTALLTLGALLQFGFVSAQVIVQERTVEPFTEIEITGTAKVELTQGALQAVTVSATSADQELVTVKNKDNVLIINSKGADGIVINVTTPSAAKVKISEAASLKGLNVFNQPQMVMEANGAATIKMEIETNALEAHLNGASSVSLAGKADVLNLKMTGAANSKLEGLEVNTATVSASGASSAKLNVKEKLEGKVTGAASVKLVSEPVSNMLENSSVIVKKEIIIEEGEVELAESLEALEMLDSIMPEDFDVEVIHKIKEGKEKKKKKFNGHFGGVELGINTYLNNNDEFTLPAGADYMELKMPNSLVVNLNLLEANLPIIRNHLGIVTGLGIEFNNYKFENSNFLDKENGEITPVAPDPGIEFIKSKLSVSYLKVPFMLEFQTNSGSKKNSFHLGGGANLGLRLNSHTKYKYEEDGKVNKEKEFDRFYLNPFRVAGIVKFGWGPLNFFAEYNLLSLFETGKGPELYPVSFGIALANWD